MTYLTTDPYQPRATIPPAFDPAQVERALDEMTRIAPNANFKFTDEHSVAVAVEHVKSLEHAKAVLRGAGHGAFEVPFWRLVPEKFVKQLRPTSHTGSAMGVARGLWPSFKGISLEPGLLAATDDELRALIAALVTGPDGIRIEEGASPVARRIAALVTDAQLDGLWKQLSIFPTNLFAHALSDAQVKRLWNASSGDDIYHHAVLRFEALHRGFYDTALLERDLARPRRRRITTGVSGISSSRRADAIRPMDGSGPICSAHSPPHTGMRQPFANRSADGTRLSARTQRAQCSSTSCSSSRSSPTTPRCGGSPRSSPRNRNRSAGAVSTSDHDSARCSSDAVMPTRFSRRSGNS